eukprot:scaffold25785_cov137-Amphora_coffeaeformis.AAC.1
MSSSSPFEVNDDDDDDDDEDALHQRNNCRYKVLVMRLLTVPEEEEELLLPLFVLERNRKDVLAAVVIVVVVLFLVVKKKKTRLDDPRPKTQNVMFRRDIYGMLKGGREKSQANKQTKQTTTRAIRCCPGAVSDMVDETSAQLLVSRKEEGSLVGWLRSNSFPRGTVKTTELFFGYCSTLLLLEAMSR